MDFSDSTTTTTGPLDFSPLTCTKNALFFFSPSSLQFVACVINPCTFHFLPFALSKLKSNDQSESQALDFAFSGDGLLCANSLGGADLVGDVDIRTAFPCALHQQSPTKRTRDSSGALEETFAYFFNGVTPRNTGTGLVCRVGALHILWPCIIVCRRRI